MLDAEGHPIREDPVLGVVGGGERVRLRPDVRAPRRHEAARALTSPATTRTRSTSGRSRTTDSRGGTGRATSSTSRRSGSGPAVVCASRRLRPGSADRGTSTASGDATSDEARGVTVGADRRTYEGSAWIVVVGERAVQRRRDEALAALLPGGRGAGRPGVQGPQFGRLHDDPAMYRHGDHVPIRTSRSCKREEAARGRGRPSVADRGRRRGARDHPGDVPVIPHPILMKL